MSNQLKHALQQPFIFATGLSAGIHSAWSLGTMFSGRMPVPGLTGQFIFWIVPAVLIAFAIDIGQIATSAEIRAGQRSRAKYGTFIVLALATYYLQFIYIVHHMPALEIADGVALFPGAAELVRNAAVWVIPALLPISTILYTAGNDENAQPVFVRQEVTPVEPTTPLLQETSEVKNSEFVENDDPQEGEIMLPESTNFAFDVPLYKVECNCGWQGEYESEKSATNALNRHRGYCSLVTVSTNGHHE